MFHFTLFCFFFNFKRLFFQKIYFSLSLFLFLLKSIEFFPKNLIFLLTREFILFLFLFLFNYSFFSIIFFISMEIFIFINFLFSVLFFVPRISLERGRYVVVLPHSLSSFPFLILSYSFLYFLVLSSLTIEVKAN